MEFLRAFWFFLNSSWTLKVFMQVLYLLEEAFYTPQLGHVFMEKEAAKIAFKKLPVDLKNPEKEARWKSFLEDAAHLFLDLEVLLMDD